MANRTIVFTKKSPRDGRRNEFANNAGLNNLEVYNTVGISI